MKKQFTIFLILVFILGLVPANFSNAAVSATKLKGRILLQVESKGEAWYVDPKTGEKNYMANGDEAYNIMRNLGVGITNKDLEKIKNNKNSAVKHSGKIFLQVESKGEAYYVDFSGNLHYLKNGSEAYGVMRNLGLGITNKDLDKISMSVKSKFPPITITPPIVSSNESSNVIEENFSDVAVKLCNSQKETAQVVIDSVEKSKDVFRSIKQLWADELTKTKVYLNAYPNNSSLALEYKIYDTLVQLADVHIVVLEEKKQRLVGLIEVINPVIATYSNEKVSRSQMPAIFKTIDDTKNYIKVAADDIAASNKKVMDANHNAAVALDASHQVEVAKNQQYINETNALIADSQRTIQYAQASMQQAQNQINSMRASQPTYCTATNMGMGTVNVVCNQ